MRDRSGFDLDGNGQADRGAPDVPAPGLYLSYTDEAHGYGNAGTDDPPAQSPLDSVPEPGSDDARTSTTRRSPPAAGRSTFSDVAATAHIDNYTDPSSASGNWEFDYDCLGFTCHSMTGDGTTGPAGGRRRPDRRRHVHDGRRLRRRSTTATTTTGAGGEHRADAAATATPTTAPAGSQVTLDASGSTDAETPNDLDYSWDFGNGGTTKDATGPVVEHVYGNAGTYDATVTVSDPPVSPTRPPSGSPSRARSAHAAPTRHPPRRLPGRAAARAAARAARDRAGAGQATVAVTSTAPAALVARPALPGPVGRPPRQLAGAAGCRARAAPTATTAGSDRSRRARGSASRATRSTSCSAAAKAGGKAVLFVDGTRIGTVLLRGSRVDPASRPARGDQRPRHRPAAPPPARA